MLESFRRKQIEKLWQKGKTLLAEGSYREALGVARELEEKRYSGAFDLAAQAHAALGELPQAIEVLERGVAAAPDVWLNWQLLGNLRSDAGKFDEAAEAYERALGCEAVWASAVRLNQAILAERRDRFSEALDFIDRVQDAELEIPKADVKARLLVEAGRPEAAA